MRMPKRGEKGFTLIELLIVVAILGVLAAVVIPNVGRFLGRGEEEARKTEFANVSTAVIAMMTDNNITSIPAPILAAAATNNMAAFPDATTTAVAKGLSAGDGAGYLLFGHDKTDDGGTTVLENYVNFTSTTWKYSVTADGTVTQGGKA